ncbi:MAG: hypothetical protein K6U08_01135 [Firmicutes bacterium]|nr:hypothetical protein [Bacillota bacterium]
MRLDRLLSLLAGEGPDRPGRLGLALAAPLFLVPVVLARASGGAASGAYLLVVVAGLVAVGLGRELVRPRLVAAPPWWAGAALQGLAVGLTAALAWAAVGAPGGWARLWVLVALGCWTASAELSLRSERRAQVAAAGLALAALTGLVGLGYATLSGLIYFLGPPVALVTLLAGRFASQHGGGDLLSLAYVLAALASALLAWVDWL